MVVKLKSNISKYGYAYAVTVKLDETTFRKIENYRKSFSFIPSMQFVLVEIINKGLESLSVHAKETTTPS